MKKTLIVIALAMALVFAFAVPAFAKYAGFSSGVQYIPWATAQSMASANTDAALMAQGPHKGYATTTIKCAVCHSVHRGGTQLLNEGAACAYCHTNSFWGGGAVASNLISWNVSTVVGGPHRDRCSNDDCHGGPHGVGASAYAGPASKLLTAKADTKLVQDAAANGLAVGTLATYSANTRVVATGAVCSRNGCHVDSAFGVVTSGAQLVADIDSMSGGAGTIPEAYAGQGTVAGELVTGHRVIATATNNWNANGTDFPTTKTNLTIAFASVSYCNSCHDLADDNNGGKKAFPHAIDGVVNAAVGETGANPRAAVWLTVGAYAGDTRTVVGAYNNYAGPMAGSTILDGQCLKCHRGSSTTGVGLTY